MMSQTVGERSGVSHGAWRAGEVGEGSGKEAGQGAALSEGLRRANVALHDLCQPLTTLQCRLEMAQMLDTQQDYRETVGLGLTECARLSASVISMREALREMMMRVSG